MSSGPLYVIGCQGLKVKLLVLQLLGAEICMAFSGVTGTIQDRSHAPIEGALIRIWDPSAGQRFETTSAGGRYAFTGIPAGEYLIRVEKTGMSVLLGAFRLPRDSAHVFNLVLVQAPGGRAGAVRAGSPDEGSPPSGRAIPKIAPGKVTPARIIRQPAPAPMKASGFGQSTRVAAVIHADGSIDDLMVLSAPDSDFAMAALMAVRQWQYSPTLLDGKAVEVTTTMDVHFHPRD